MRAERLRIRLTQLQLYHAKAETLYLPFRLLEKRMVATLPCQSGNLVVELVIGRRRGSCNFTMPKRKLIPMIGLIFTLSVATLPCQSGNCVLRMVAGAPFLGCNFTMPKRKRCLRRLADNAEGGGCNFTMPKRKHSTLVASRRRNALLQLYHAKAETYMRVSETRVTGLGCNFTMPKRKLVPAAPASVELELQLYHAKAETQECQKWHQRETNSLQLYHAKAETMPSQVRVPCVGIVATLPCQSGNIDVEIDDERERFRCNFTMPKRKRHYGKTRCAIRTGCNFTMPKRKLHCHHAAKGFA